MNLSDKKVLVLGLGESGLAAAQWLVRSGAVLRVADTREAPDRLPQLMAAAPYGEFIGGPFTATLLDGIDVVVVSPGLSELAELSEIAPVAKERGIPVISGIEMFVQQGARQFEIWTGKPAPEAEMMRVVELELRRRG